ncbi:hypothetical protein [Staphylococcus phage S25-3]|uniref:Uncharacterized protein n=2 Tax=Kayvirus TaxID=1857843 RepID=V5XWB0_BPS25|nr:hypothetical protein X577_gp184 [Staphylococcus phage S25-4]YP_008854339.1 hypothetical protein X600_gp002 [Staphylococcus phage S25-3]BAO09367.1 hypothetical protein [Staphylococcus phage S25-3]BAO09369.1 hypothetical protein [Staphylococcus phage S25-4]
MDKVLEFVVNFIKSILIVLLGALVVSICCGIGIFLSSLFLSGGDMLGVGLFFGSLIMLSITLAIFKTWS